MRILGFLVAVGLLQPVQQSNAVRTELIVRAVDEAGRPVRLTRADLYFDVWGGNEVTPLPHSGNVVRIGLDRSAACALEPQLCAIHPAFSARILLEAENLAPVSSDLFDWMSQAAQTTRLPPVEIRFPGAVPLRFTPGTRRDVTIRFRAKQPRRLRVVDRAGAPVVGARVSVMNLFAATNHMGMFEGDAILDERPTDARGEVEVPDGDITYGVQIGKPHWSIEKPRPGSWPDQIAQRIDVWPLTVVMRRHARLPLLLRFVRDGDPVAGLAVSACVAPCGGACCGPIGTTDAAGNLTVRDFHPEEYDRVFVPLPADPYRSVWEIDPRRLRQPARRMTVQLPR
jgi:hypothetical protein